jgi:hypothetical protein
MEPMKLIKVVLCGLALSVLAACSPVVVVPENPAKRDCESKGGRWNTAVPYCEYQMP